MASVVIDTIAPELHLTLGLNLDPTLAVAGDAVVGDTGELAALGYSDASVPIGMDNVGDDVQGLAALDVHSGGCRQSGREQGKQGDPRVSPNTTNQEPSPSSGP